jgi:hypothetical protein
MSKGSLVIKPVVVPTTDLRPGRLQLAALLAVASFALVVSFVSASEWRFNADLKVLAAVGGTMLNLVTGCIVYWAVRLRTASAAPSSGFVDEDLAREQIQDTAGAGENR